MQQYTAMQCSNTRLYNATTQRNTRPLYKAVNGSAKQNLRNYVLESELTIMPGERRGIHAIQHNTNNITTDWSTATARTAIKQLYTTWAADDGHGALTHAQGARQPAFQQGYGQDRPQGCCCCIYLPNFLRGNEDHYDYDSDPAFHSPYFVLWSKKMAFARAMVILCPFVIWFSRKFLSWMVLFWSLLDQFVRRFDRANGLSIFQFDAVQFIDFSAKDFDRWVQWIRDSCFVFNFWKSKIKIYVGVDVFIVLILSFKTRCLISASSPV